jgi:hypothetical protein
MATNPATRHAFQQTSDAASYTARVTQGLGGVTATMGDGERGAYLVGAAVLFDVLGMITQKWANDPPRDDYDSSTRLRRPIIREEASPDPEDTVAREAYSLAVLIDEADAHLAAALRAYERMQGALERERRDLATERVKEARDYAHDAAPDLCTSERALRTGGSGSTISLSALLATYFRPPPRRGLGQLLV